MFSVCEEDRIELIEENAKYGQCDKETDREINPVHNPITPLNPLHAHAIIPMMVEIV